MNEASTTYQSDYTPIDWLQNNIALEKNQFSFCTLDNVDECLKYISKEFCALGYPSIYSYSNDCPSAVNCDIVNFLNVTNELLRCNNDYTQTKEDLKCRNQRLISDLNAFNKKNSQLKCALEQTERKLASTLERERQLKEKNEQLSQLLKNEKEETKKLAGQLRQQKFTYQHEFRKYENNMNHIKTKLNQMLSDKNPNKKIANINTQHPLTRSTGQRGKWKTGTTATTAIDDMYSSVIFNYENSIKDMGKELNAFRQCLQTVLLEIFKLISVYKDEVDGNNCSATTEEFILNDLKNASKNVHTFEDKFKCLIRIWKETASEKTDKITENFQDKLNALKLKISNYENLLEKSQEISQVNAYQMYVNSAEAAVTKQEIAKSSAEEFIKNEKMKLDEEKLALSKSYENFEKEKADLSAQKLSMLKFAMQQKAALSSWHQSLSSFPSVSVITSQSGESKILTPHELQSCLSSPVELGLGFNKETSVEWKSSSNIEDVFISKSNPVLLSESRSATESPVFFTSLQSSDSDLPTWAIQNSTVEICQSSSAEEIELINESSTEEIELMRLKAAAQDMEERRLNMS